MTTSFPTLRISRDHLEPQGAFAVAQAAFLQPDAVLVRRIGALCKEKSVGIVAHFYMDAELQGVLAAVPWEHVVVADSLKMADAAVQMAQAGMGTIIVLGVDFMSENARAVLDAAGFPNTDVYRVASDAIGCSLAESAEGAGYAAWLAQAAQTPTSLHVVYINTRLETKAQAHHVVPTITCTSSNVVQTILQADAQVPDLHVWYGPDTYMGSNLQTMFTQFAGLSDSEIQAIHPNHNRTTINALLQRFHVFQDGNCVVHHLFGADVVRRVQEEHAASFYTAHLEVPGEMFALAVKAAASGRGVVGSTSNILGFIASKVQENLDTTEPRELSFVLGTEAGMVTAIVNKVQDLLRSADNQYLTIEIVFPVASEAVAAAPGTELGIVPGVASGEGCSVAGGCATCPYMKMNTLDAVFDVLEMLHTPAQSSFETYRPRQYTNLIGGRTAAAVGSEPILHMRYFQTHGRMPAELVEDVLSR